MHGRLLLFHRFSTVHATDSFPEAGRIGGREPEFNLTAAVLAMPTQSTVIPAYLSGCHSLVPVLTNYVSGFNI